MAAANCSLPAGRDAMAPRPRLPGRSVLVAAIAAVLLAPVSASRAEEPLSVPSTAPAAAALGEALRVKAVKAVLIPWNTTRESWEQTKDVATEHWKVIPFAQVATGFLALKTVLSTPYDLLAAPFRRKSRSRVEFELRGRIVDDQGKPASNARLVVRCTSPYESLPNGNGFNYYETGRFRAVTDAEGRVALEGDGLTGLVPKFMLHLDLEDTPDGASSAGAYAISVASATPTFSTEMPGSWRLLAETP